MGYRLTSKTAIVAFTLLGVLAAVGVGYAAIPGGDGTIKGCYATSKGLLLGIPHSKGDTRIVDSGEACRSYEKTIAWNQQGPKGDQGDRGAQGATGAQGPQGAQGPKGDTGLTGPAGPQGPTGSQGPAGPQGPTGDKGDKGDRGEPGPSEAFTGFTPTRAVLSNGALHEVAALTLPPGDYAVTATASLFDNDRAASANCVLRSGPNQQDSQFASFGEDEQSKVTFLGTFALPSGGTVVVQCSTGDDGVQSHVGHILALRVGRVP
jgi:hypothetical protein